MIEDYIKVIKGFEEMNTTISGLSTQILKTKGELAEIDEQLDKIRQNEMRDITQETDAKGKAIFSNAEMRQAELSNRLQGNPEFVALATAKKDKSKFVAETEIQKAEMQRRWEMMLHLIR